MTIETDAELVEGVRRGSRESILDDQEDRLEAYWERRMPEMRAIVEQTYDEIRVVLTPQQRAAFDERVRAQRTRVPESIRD